MLFMDFDRPSLYFCLTIPAWPWIFWDCLRPDKTCFIHVNFPLCIQAWPCFECATVRFRAPCAFSQQHGFNCMLPHSLCFYIWLLTSCSYALETSTPFCAVTMYLLSLWANIDSFALRACCFKLFCLPWWWKQHSQFISLFSFMIKSSSRV